MPFCYGEKQIGAGFSCDCPVIGNEFRHNTVKLVCRRNSWWQDILMENKHQFVKWSYSSRFHKLKFLKLKITMKHIKISPGSKSCNSQQEVKSCFGIRWYAFHRQDLLEVCRIQTSSAGKKESDKGRKLAQRSTTEHLFSVLTVYKTVLIKKNNRIGLFEFRRGSNDYF